MNKVILIGRLVADPETRQTQVGGLVSRYRLAVDRQRGKDGQREADFISCVAFGKSAEFAGKFLHKGTKIAVEGRMTTGSYEKEGVKHYTTDVVIDRHEFCESRAGAASATPTQYSAPPVQTSPAVLTGSDDFMPIDDNEDLPF